MRQELILPFINNEPICWTVINLTNNSVVYCKFAILGMALTKQSTLCILMLKVTDFDIALANFSFQNGITNFNFWNLFKAFFANGDRFVFKLPVSFNTGTSDSTVVRKCRCGKYQTKQY